MKLFPDFSPSVRADHGWRADLGKRLGVLALGIVIFGGTGTLLVRASDNPEIQKVMREFNRPIRQAAEPYMPRPETALPQLFRARNAMPAQALGYAPQTLRLQPLPRLLPEPALPAARSQRHEPPRNALPQVSSAPEAAIPVVSPRARQRLQARAEGNGAPFATNYCVRLCDGFAFPVGRVGTGSWNVQESACRSACPGADTALFSAPAGAKDFDALSRGGLSYSALPSAFRYRQQISDTCSCRPVGTTQSTAALLRDQTLHRGDLVMTRTGARHFDGSTRVPYRLNQFSDAVSKLTNKKEIAIVRAMEVAAVRGIVSINASPELRNRVAFDIRQAEKTAAQTRATATPTQAAGLPRGFVELQTREKRGAVVLTPVKRTPGLVALN